MPSPDVPAADAPTFGAPEAGAASEPRAFLCTYWPLVRTARGRRAVLAYGLPPYVNGMGRREPDLEHARPVITASSRGANFAPRLQPADTVVYLTTKGRYGERPDGSPRPPHWRLVAALEVLKRFPSHGEAAQWYRAEGHVLPSNLMVDGNPPVPVPLTARHGYLHDDGWDAVCAERAQASGTVLACAPRYLELHAPPVVTTEHLLALFGTVPNTRTPPQISPRALDGLLALTEDVPEDRPAWASGTRWAA